MIESKFIKLENMEIEKRQTSNKHDTAKLSIQTNLSGRITFPEKDGTPLVGLTKEFMFGAKNKNLQKYLPSIPHQQKWKIAFLHFIPRPFFVAGSIVGEKLDEPCFLSGSIVWHPLLPDAKLNLHPPLFNLLGCLNWRHSSWNVLCNKVSGASATSLSQSSHREIVIHQKVWKV